jgi:hypothetical protein
MVFVPPRDRVLEHSTSNSQTVFTVTGAVDASMNPFGASMSVGDTTIGGVVEPGVAFKSGKLTYSAANQVTVDSTGYESKGTFSAGGTKEVFMGLPAKSAVVQLVSTPQGRMTLASGIPVMTTTQSSKTNLYYTPYVGNMVPLYDGTNMVPTAFAELSIATTDTAKNPAAVSASKINDWFVWNDAGTIRLSHGPDWTNDTTRSAGTGLVMVSGILLNNASIANGPAASRGTYVGTTRSNAFAQLDWIFGGSAAGGLAAFLGVWNAYNRRDVPTGIITDSTVSWSYVGGFRASNNSTGMRANFVIGLSEDAVTGAFTSYMTNGASSAGVLGIGLDSTAANFGTATGGQAVGTSAPLTSIFNGMVGIGFHYLQALEKTAGTGTVTFYGSNSMVDTYGNSLFANVKM